MTWLDLVCVLLLGFVAVGGYVQGLIRGLVRLLFLLVFGGLALLSVRNNTSDTAGGAAALALVVAAAGIVLAGLTSWFVARSVPAFIHKSLLNRVLGFVPALVLALVVFTVVLGFVERTALTSETQALIRAGVLTGPLVQVTDVVEQMVAGIR